MSIILEGRNLTKSYEGVKIIEDVSLSVRKGEMVSLLGVSGVGKSTLFNILSGLEMPDWGKVYLDGEIITGIAGKVGYMQQSDLLLPFKKICENVMIPMVLAGCDKKDARRRAEDILKEFSLTEYKDMYPSQLSGGMRQRVALARIFMTGNDVLLLDEPFSALDAITRGDVQRWFKKVIKSRGASTVFITHDVDEAIILSDRIYILGGDVGRITDEIIVDINDTDDTSEEFIKLKKKILEKVK